MPRSEYVIGGSGETRVWLTRDGYDRSSWRIFVGPDRQNYQSAFPRTMNQRDLVDLRNALREIVGGGDDPNQTLPEPSPNRAEGWTPDRHVERLLTIGDYTTLEVYRSSGSNAYLGFATVEEDGHRTSPTWMERAKAKELVQTIYGLFEVEADTDNEPWFTPATLPAEEAVQLIEQIAAAHNLSVAVTQD